MALETTNDAAESWRLIRGAAINAKRLAQTFSAELSASSVTIERVFEMYRQFKNMRAQIETEKTTAGLVEFVKLVRNDSAYDVTADINAATAAVQAALDWVDANASGIALTGDTASNYLASGSVVSNRFTPAQTSGLRDQLADIVTSIG